MFSFFIYLLSKKELKHFNLFFCVGCNVYGKYYKINDKVTVLSKKCTDCVCLPDGIACNATC